MIAYRPDIDGLRGLAVMLVVLFHAGLPGLNGGFIGVDIFFVISGYLITSIIAGEAASNSFSFLGFYERRARRILPALYVMLIASLTIAFFLQVPTEFEKTSASMVSALLFSANIFFWKNTGYFNESSDFEPFLHTWSLGVEEQFYILFPLLILAFFRHRKGLLAAILTCLLISFCLSVYGSHQFEWAAYYLLPSRAWQLMAGAILALLTLRVEIRPIQANLVAAAALLMIVIPAVTYSSDTLFPGVAALWPTMGAMLLIVLGTTCSTFITRLLSYRPLVAMGLISYSLYLWHWPVFAFIRTYYASAHIPPGASLLALCLSVLLAYISWKYVEQPFRNKRLFKRSAIFGLSAASSAALLAFGALVIMQNGLPGRMPPEVVKLASYSDSYIVADECINVDAADIIDGDPCVLATSSNGKPQWVLWGDSHAGSLKKEFSFSVKQHRIGALFFGRLGCPPLIGATRINFSSAAECSAFNTAALNYIKNSKTIDTVVLAARWALSSEGTRYGLENGANYIWADDESESVGIDHNRSVVERSLTRTIDQLVLNDKTVIIVGPVPEVGWDVPRVLANNALWSIDRAIAPTAAEFYDRQEFVIDLLTNLDTRNNVSVVWPHARFCPSDLCQVELDGEPLYFDDNHVSDLGAREIISLIKPLDSRLVHSKDL